MYNYTCVYASSYAQLQEYLNLSILTIIKFLFLFFFVLFKYHISTRIPV